MVAPPKNQTRLKHTRGLTLMETSLATIIVGLAVLSIVKLVSATTTQTGFSQKLTIAYMLGNNIRELTATLPFNEPLVGNHVTYPAASGPGNVPSGVNSVTQYNDVQDFDGYAACPPIDGNRQPIAALTNWRQSVSVQMLGDINGLHINNPNTTSGSANPAVVERVRVTVSFSSTGAAPWTPIVTLSWLKTKY